MRFYQKGQLIETLELCYSCKEIRFSNSQKTGAIGILGTMSSGLEKAGFTISRNWRNLAEEHLKTIEK